MNIVKLSQVAPGQLCFSVRIGATRSWCNNVELEFKAPMLVIKQTVMEDTEGSQWPIATVLTERGVLEFSGAHDVTFDGTLKGFERVPRSY
jgi:hypothetical protein